MTKVELGTKRTCPSCGTKYYDLNHSPIVCPKCGTEFELAVVARPRAAPVKAAAKAETEAETEPDEKVETISLEEADDEATETGAVKVEGDDEDIEDEDDDTFLAPDEDDEDETVEDIVGDVDEEDT